MSQIKGQEKFGISSQIFKPATPKGFRDFGSVEMMKRTFIFDTIKKVFQKYGFMPLETPSMENLDVLTGKYGDEGDQLLYKVLNTGDFLSKTINDDFTSGSKNFANKIASKGLRYDLTVPFARYVVKNQGEITFPFKRYQIQPVWRADRPQKGRYREFYQCDADVVGTKSLICETEILLMIKEVFSLLGILDYSIKINSRKILTGITEAIGATGQESTFLVAIDKLDKIGPEKVLEELRVKDFSEASILKIKPFLTFNGSNQSVMSSLKETLLNSEIGLEGVEEIETIFSLLKDYRVNESNIALDPNLARGLSYYTGAIFEVKINNVKIGSVGGGGRYDNLTESFGLKDVSGVGFSFGVDRIYDVMEELNIFPESNLTSTTVMLVNFDEQSQKHALGLLHKLREADITSEIYPEFAKVKKQMTYAHRKRIPYVLIIGSKEIEDNTYGLKNMTTGEQNSLSIDEIIKRLA